MRYEYKIVRDKIVGPGGPMQSSTRKMQNLLFYGMNNLPIEEKDKDLSGDVEFCYGGSFMPCEGTYDEHPLYMTDPSIIWKYKDKQHEAKLELAKYFGGESNIDDGYIGKWNQEINEHAHIYYILMEDGPHEVFLTQYNDMKFVTNVQQAQYVVNINGNMIDCTPEENDILFDDFEEASKYFKDVYVGEMKLKMRNRRKRGTKN